MGSGDVFEQWRTADDEAVAAGQALFRKSMLALDGKGEPPSAAEAQELRRLRRAANDQFEAAMARIGAAVSGRAEDGPTHRRERRC